MGSAIQKDGTQLQNNNFDSFQAFTYLTTWLQALLVNASTYVSWKIPLYQNYKRQKEKYSSNEAFDC